MRPRAASSARRAIGKLAYRDQPRRRPRQESRPILPLELPAVALRSASVHGRAPGLRKIRSALSSHVSTKSFVSAKVLEQRLVGRRIAREQHRVELPRMIQRAEHRRHLHPLRKRPLIRRRHQVRPRRLQVRMRPRRKKQVMHIPQPRDRKLLPTQTGVNRLMPPRTQQRKCQKPDSAGQAPQKPCRTIFFFSTEPQNAPPTPGTPISRLAFPPPPAPALTAAPASPGSPIPEEEEGKNGGWRAGEQPIGLPPAAASLPIPNRLPSTPFLKLAPTPPER